MTDCKKVIAGLKPIYRAAPETAALKALDVFETEWGGIYPAIVRCGDVTAHGSCRSLLSTPAIRKIIYTTNAIESLNYQLRKITKTRGSFPTDDAAFKILHLGIGNITDTIGGELGTGTENSWLRGRVSRLSRPGAAYAHETDGRACPSVPRR